MTAEVGPATTRSDIYSLGVVLYQLLVADFRRPLTADWVKHITDPLLREDLEHWLAGNPEERFAGAVQLATSLRNLPQRRADIARQQAQAVERARLQRQAEQRHKVVIISGTAAALLLLLATVLGYGLNRAEKQRQRAEAYLYDADMNLAQQAIQDNNLGNALDLLSRHRPAKTGQRDRRGWEWRYLWDRCRSDELATIGQHGGYVQSGNMVA